MSVVTEQVSAVLLYPIAYYVCMGRFSNFHAEAVRIWPFTGTSPQGGCHWDRALEVAYQLPAAQCGHN